MSVCSCSRRICVYYDEVVHFLSREIILRTSDRFFKTPYSEFTKGWFLTGAEVIVCVE